MGLVDTEGGDRSSDIMTAGTLRVTLSGSVMHRKLSKIR